MQVFETDEDEDKRADTPGQAECADGPEPGAEGPSARLYPFGPIIT
ncbi:MAG: hypothetical protein GX936_06950 [Clostridiales bacterium]|nr:hypothetical protein [Clostridiales bacterium]